MNVFTKLKALQTHALGILCRLSHIGFIYYKVNFQPLSGEWEVEAWKYKTSNHGFVFLVAISHPGAHPDLPH